MEKVEHSSRSILLGVIKEELLDKSANQISRFDLRDGMTVVDYTCCSGKNLKALSDMVGVDGEVIAVDIDPRGIKTQKKIASRHKLKNVEICYGTEYDSTLPDDIADVVIVSDLFCKTRRPGLMLSEFRRILKNTGTVYVDVNDKSMEEAIKRFEESSIWTIVSRHKSYIVCK